MQPTLAPLRRWDPERIGPFTLLGRLGAGAMGQVYLGRSTAGRLVAVKTIKIEFAEEAGFRARFAHEVAAARRVSGVFTAAVVAADAEADMPWLATAYVPAPSLNRLVRAAGPLPVPAVRWLAAGCAEALESIHTAGLVHRDLKPSNVLVSPDGPRVIDFGVARAAERIQLTVTRGAVGTPAYMAPEQARDTRQASGASDVFSLGATLVFAATGHAPYRGETVMDVLVRLATEPPDLDGLPADLAGLVDACLERSPRRRPTSASLLAQLAPFVGGLAGPGAAQAYLTGPALALMDHYRHSPETQLLDAGPPGTEEEEAGGDATVGSYTALPPPRTPRRPGGRGWPPGSRRRAADRSLPSQPGRRPSRLRTVATLAGGGALLLGGGVLIGALHSSGSGPPAAGAPTSQPSASSQPAATPASGQQVPPPQDGQLPPSSLPTGTSSHPELAMGQPQGDGDTVFVVHGSGFIPLTQVRIALQGVGTSPYRPTTDEVGTFNYAIDQGHLFFPGPIPPGDYTVLATGAGGRHATATFQVHGPVLRAVFSLAAGRPAR
jgi:serine/threonine protein kinase